VRLEILGCHGGELPECKTTCFLVNDDLALDAGALTSSLSLDRLTKLEHIVVSHSHFDHVKDLPLLADLLFGRRRTPVTIHASTACARALRDNMFNGSLWPDFTRLPNARDPILRIKPFRPGSRFAVGRYQIQSIKVDHPVESSGFVISDGQSSIAMSGDTGPTEKLWKVVNQVPNLRAMLVETSFPNDLQKLADVSGHLTPRTLRSELAKFQRNGSEVFLYHLKPAFVQRMKRELEGLPVQVLELGDVFEV
jgi:ribonuclease BN (tRNA processing enzyme)